jgi:nitroreductase
MAVQYGAFSNERLTGRLVMANAGFAPLEGCRGYQVTEMLRRSEAFLEELERRRSVRKFSDRPVPQKVVENCLRAAATAPSGANLQPYHFVVVTDPQTKHEIRLAAEAEEREFYARRATPEWLERLAPLGTDAHKPFLEIAPVLIAIFVQRYTLLAGGRRFVHPYAAESTGIATGVLITALHHAGLATLPHTPSPMGFLSRILHRPANERPFLLLVTGYPAEDTVVPVLERKSLTQIATFV